jgi:hypothetical protein
MSARERTTNYRPDETWSANKASAESLDRVRRRWSHRFAASIPFLEKPTIGVVWGF